MNQVDAVKLLVVILEPSSQSRSSISGWAGKFTSKDHITSKITNNKEDLFNEESGKHDNDLVEHVW